MSCTIQISTVTGFNPDSGGSPETITVQGTVSGSCLQVRAKLQLPGALSQFAVVNNGQFEAVLQRDIHYASGDVLCGANPNVTLTVDCLDGDSCQAEQRLDSLNCETAAPPCDLAFAAADPVTAVPDPTAAGPAIPATITVTGTSQDCAGVEVRFLYQINDSPQQTLWKTAVLENGAWSITFQRLIDYNKSLACGGLIQVEVRCTDNPGCRISDEFTIDCETQSDCPSAVLSAVVTDICLSGRRKVIFTVTLNNVTGQTDISGSIKTGDLSAVTEIELPVEFSAGTANTWQVQGNGIYTKTFSHHYLAGTYTASLELVGTCAAVVSLTRITDPAGDPLTSLTILACDCPEAQVGRNVCRLVKEGLTCNDEIPDDACTPISEDELEAGLEPGIYIVSATTDPPDAAAGFSWSIDGQLQEGENGDRICVILAAGDSVEVNAAVAITPNCIPSTGVILETSPDDDGGSGPGDDEGDSGEDNGDDDGSSNGNDDGTENNGGGCFPNICLIWLWATFGVSLLAGLAIAITACFLFNPATLTNAFWVGVVISVVLVVVTIISLILWAILCARLPDMCGPLVWVHDILIVLAAASGIFALILMLFGQLPCGVGFILDFAYFGLLATIAEVTIRVLGCPLGQNGIVGLVLDFLNWIGNLLGLGSGE